VLNDRIPIPAAGLIPVAACATLEEAQEQRMTRRVWIGTLALLLGTFGCKTMLDTDKLREHIRSELAKQAGVEVTSVSCAVENPPAKKDERFECRAALAPSGSLTITVVQTDDQGHIRWDVTDGTGVFRVAEFETDLATELSGRWQRKVTTACTGPRLLPYRAGGHFACTVRGAEGWTVKIDVVQEDDKGNVTWNVTESHGLILLDTLASGIADHLKEKGIREATVECGGGVRIATVGETFECTGTADGQAVAITVNVNSEDGAVGWAVTAR
jgi:hypothetical protein